MEDSIGNAAIIFKTEEHLGGNFLKVIFIFLCPFRSIARCLVYFFLVGMFPDLLYGSLLLVQGVECLGHCVVLV